MKELHPVPIPSDPLTRTIGKTGMYLTKAREGGSALPLALKDANSPSRFDTLSVVVEIIEDVLVGGMEDGAGDLRDVGEDVTSRGCIFTTLLSMTRFSRVRTNEATES